MQLGREDVLFEEVAGRDIDIDERRTHVGQVQLLGALIGVGADAAIGDHHGAAVRQERDVVRLHAMGGELTDLPVAIGRVAHADDACRALIVVLGGIEQPAGGGEDPMAEEMAVGLRGEPHRRARSDRDRNAEAAGAPGKGDPFAAVGAERHVVAAARKLYRAHIAIEAEQRRRVGTPVVLACRGEDFGAESSGAQGGDRISWQGQHDGAAREAHEKRPAVELHD